MRITRTSRFKKQFKRFSTQEKVVRKFIKLTEYRYQDIPLPGAFRDHKLSGNLKQYRELHLFPDILIIYEQDTQAQLITLAMIGSHSELFG